MAAAPFKLTLIGALGDPNSKIRKTFPCTVSDVNGEYAVFPSGGSEINLHGTQDVYIVDAICTPTYGTDTTQMEWFIAGMSSGIKTMNSSLQGATVDRPIRACPIKVPAGQSVKIKQLT